MWLHHEKMLSFGKGFVYIYKIVIRIIQLLVVKYSQSLAHNLLSFCTPRYAYIVYLYIYISMYMNVSTFICGHCCVLFTNALLITFNCVLKNINLQFCSLLMSVLQFCYKHNADLRTCSRLCRSFLPPFIQAFALLSLSVSLVLFDFGLWKSQGLLYDEHT